MAFFKWLMVVGVLVVVVHGQFFGRTNTYIEQQLMCALDKAPCDRLGSQIKVALPEVIGKNCQSCDSKQYVNAKRIAQFVQVKYPDIWNALVEKYGKKE